MMTSSNVDYIEVFPGEDDQHYWRAKASNHEIVAGSEGYVTRFDARRAAETTFPGVKIVELYSEAHQ
jgi:uncharacterized protein YegP (UPF0339 family)